MPEVLDAPAAPPAATPATDPGIAGLNLERAAKMPEGKSINRAFDDIDKRAGRPPKPEPKPEAKPTAKEAPKPEAKVELERPGADTPPPPEKKIEAAPAKEKTNIYRQYDALKEKHETLERQFTEFKSKPAEDPEKKVYAEKLTAAEKRAEELESKLRFAAYEQSDDYKENYEQPYVDAYQSGRTKIAAMKVTLPDGTQRQGAQSDFDEIMAARSDEAAAELIEQMFGTGAKAQIVTLARDKVMDKNSALNKAVDEYRKHGSEAAKMQEEADQRTAREVQDHIVKTWTQAQQETVEHEAYGEFFKPKEGDQQGNARLAKGLQLAVRAYKESPHQPGISTEERSARVRRQAAAIYRAGAFGRMAAEIKSLRTQLAERDGKLSEFEKTEPASGAAKRESGQPAGRMIDSAMADIDRRAR